jgi:hypothetical protein
MEKIFYCCEDHIQLLYLVERLNAFEYPAQLILISMTIVIAVADCVSSGIGMEFCYDETRAILFQGPSGAACFEL